MLPSLMSVDRRPAPCLRPQAIAFDGQRLWSASLATRRVHATDLTTGQSSEEGEAPGLPWGMTATPEGLCFLLGEGPEDFRRLRRFIPGQGFAADFLPCPEDTGSHLGWHGGQLTLSQWYRKRVVQLDAAAHEVRDWTGPHGIAGHVVVGGFAYLLGTDDEASLDYWISRLDLTSGEAEDVAKLPFQVRGLAFDGQRFWTHLREQHELLAFELPLP